MRFLTRLKSWFDNVTAPEVGSEWISRDEPPWTKNIYRVTKSRDGWVKYEHAITHRHQADMPIGKFYECFRYYEPTEEDKVERVCDRLEGKDTKEVNKYGLGAVSQGEP